MLNENTKRISTWKGHKTGQTIEERETGCNQLEEDSGDIMKPFKRVNELDYGEVGEIFRCLQRG